MRKYVGIEVRSSTTAIESLLVVGSGRTGTSFVAACAHYLGFPSVPGSTPRGNFEDPVLGEAIAERGGLPTARIRRLVSHRAKRSGVWTFKYPPVSESTLALRNLFPRPGIILVTRDPMQAAETASRVEGLDFGERSIDTAEHQSRVIKLAFAVADTPLLWLTFERCRADPVSAIRAIATFVSRKPSERQVGEIVQRVREAEGRYWGG